MRTYCNSLSPGRLYSCELPKDHDGKCRAEMFEGGYKQWEAA